MTHAASKRILYVCALEIAKQDGPALHVEAVVKRMAAMGHRVTLIQVGNHNIKGVDVVPLDNPPAGLFRGAKLRNAMQKEIEKQLKAGDVRALYMRGSFPGILRQAKNFNVKLVVEYNSVLAQELEVAKVSKLRRWLQLARESYVARGCDAAVAVDSATQKEMIKLYPSLRTKCVEILNGCDVEAFEPHAGDDVDPKRIVFVGTFFPWARIDLCIEAFATLGEGFHFDIIGDGQRRDELKSLAEKLGVGERIKFHGRLPHQEIPPLLARAALGLAIEADGFTGSLPLKVSEYLAAGCVLVANRYDCHTELEKLGHAKLVDNPPSSDGIANAIKTALESVANDSNGAKARHQYAKEHLSWNRTTNEIVKLIDGLESQGGDKA